VLAKRSKSQRLIDNILILVLVYTLCFALGNKIQHWKSGSGDYDSVNVEFFSKIFQQNLVGVANVR